YNKAAEELWGRKPEIGKDRWCGSWRMRDNNLTPITLDECPMSIVLRDGRPIAPETFVVDRPDGTRRYIIPHPTPLFDEQGQISGALNAVIDITRQREAEQAALQSETRYRQLVDSLPVALYTCDPDGRILIHNKADAELWKREPIEGKDLWS